MPGRRPFAIVDAGKIVHNQRFCLSGARVLVIQDEYYIADDLRRVLKRAGALVV
jgi:hypothetical protein